MKRIICRLQYFSEGDDVERNSKKRGGGGGRESEFKNPSAPYSQMMILTYLRLSKIEQ